MFYLAPLCDLCLCDVFDGDRRAVLDPFAGVNDAETALAKDSADAVGPLEGFPPPVRRQYGLQVRPGLARQAPHRGQSRVAVATHFVMHLEND